MNEPTETIADELPHAELKRYSTPTLTDFGSVETITKGAIGVGADNGIYS